MMGMKDSHRMFLQSFMTRGLLDAMEVRLLYKACCERHGETYETNEEERRNKLQEFVITINNDVKAFGMEIKKGVSEVEGSSFYGLVNTTENNITLLSSTYTANELDFFKLLLEQIVESEKGMLGSIDTVNLVEGLTKKMTKYEAEELLGRLQREKWVVQTRGQVSLGTRSIMELEQYIFDMYPSFAVRCNMCKKLCLQGQSCEECNTRLHFHCAKRYFRGQTTPKCPGDGCRAPWKQLVNREPEATGSPSRAERSSQRKRKSTA